MKSFTPPRDGPRSTRHRPPRDNGPAVDDADDATPAVPGTPTEVAWRSLSGKLVTIHAPEGSYAATRAPAELAEADAAVATLAELLQHDGAPDGPVEIYLTDGAGLAGDDDSVAGGRALVRAIQPEAPGEPGAGPLTRRLGARWRGPGAAPALALPPRRAGQGASQPAAMAPAIGSTAGYR